MNAHLTRLDTAAVLIEAATRCSGRVSRIAVHAAPEMRLRLMGELALVEMALDLIENYVAKAARGALAAVGDRPALPPPGRALTRRKVAKAVARFHGGRIRSSP